ncbi:YaeQ family protein [Teredinibacter turnerae]|uniref:YaeQ family protein n=1 Tax=Teredinibacter turnerae TaxID=2426 RepID=UPI0030CE70F8
MALNATIYKCTVHLNDFDRSIFDSLQLTLALHPSEKPERMLVRLMAYCLHYHERLEFTKGLSTPETPDIWLKSLHDTVDLWVDVGEPAAEKIKKACRQATEVWVYSFNTKSDVWWQQSANAYEPLSAEVRQFDFAAISTLAEQLERTCEMSVSITDSQLTVTIGDRAVELVVNVLQSQQG